MTQTERENFKRNTRAFLIYMINFYISVPLKQEKVVPRVAL